MPQPMSTPTADGMTAPLVGITEPTVAPMPTWASGMRATWPSTMGSRAVFSAWRLDVGDRRPDHLCSPNSGPPPGRVHPSIPEPGSVLVNEDAVNVEDHTAGAECKARMA